MTEYVFSCRIDGRAGYVRLWSDALELLRSGRRGAGDPEFVWLGAVTSVAIRKPGRLFTTVELLVDGGRLRLTFPAPDAPRVAELIEALVAAHAQQAEQVPAPAAPLAPPVTMFSLPAEVPSVEVPSAPWFEVPPVELPDVDPPEFVGPDFSIVAPDMPEWTPLPEVDEPEGGGVELVTDPLPEGAVLAAAAALAELEDMLDQIPVAVGAPSDGPSDVPSVDVVEAERPADLPDEAEKRLSRLEVLRSCGIVTEADFADAEAEILSSVWPEARSA